MTSDLVIPIRRFDNDEVVVAHPISTDTQQVIVARNPIEVSFMVPPYGWGSRITAKVRLSQDDLFGNDFKGKQFMMGICYLE